MLYDYASLHHFDYWTTVLSVSPHKNSQWINEIGASFPQEKTQFLFSDFKKNNGYLKSVNLQHYIIFIDKIIVVVFILIKIC